MKRLTVDEVLEAYEKTGMIPISRTYKDKNCGCGIGVHAMHKGELEDGTHPTKQYLDEFEPGYDEGFYIGFDGDKFDIGYAYENNYDDYDDYFNRKYYKTMEIGYEDGKSVREAVIAKYGDFE